MNKMASICIAEGISPASLKQECIQDGAASMTVGELRKALDDYPEDMEVWATPCFIPFDEAEHFAVQTARPIRIIVGHRPNYFADTEHVPGANGRRVLGLGML